MAESYQPNGVVDSIAVSPPTVHSSPAPRTYALAATDVAAIQALRDEGVSRSSIANQFKISNHFIGVITAKNVETAKKEALAVKKAKAKWNHNTSKAAFLKSKRQASWSHL